MPNITEIAKTSAGGLLALTIFGLAFAYAMQQLGLPGR
jgi:hypothetical protein